MVDVAAIAAAPDHIRPLTGENPAFLNIAGKIQIALFMPFFRHGDGAHHRGDFAEAFPGGDSGETRIHFRILVALSRRRGKKVAAGVGDNPGREGGTDLQLAPFQEFKKAFGVLLFLICRFGKNSLYLNETFVFRLGGEKGIPVAGLGFTGKGGEDVFFRLGTFQCCHLLFS